MKDSSLRISSTLDWSIQRACSLRVLILLILRQTSIQADKLASHGDPAFHSRCTTKCTTTTVVSGLCLSLKKKNPPLCCRRLHVFLRGGDNSRHWKLQTLARCLEECARRLSQRAHSQCLSPCLCRWIQDPRSWKKRDHEFKKNKKKKQMGVRTKRGRNGKRWLLESLHSSFVHLKWV